MDKIDMTRQALWVFLQRPLEAGTVRVWPGIGRTVEGMNLVDAYVQAKTEALEEMLEAIVVQVACVPHEEGDLKPPWHLLAGRLAGSMCNVEALARFALAPSRKTSVG